MENTRVISMVPRKASMVSLEQFKSRISATTAQGGLQEEILSRVQISGLVHSDLMEAFGEPHTVRPRN